MEQTLEDFLAGREFEGFSTEPQYFRVGDYLTRFLDDAPAYENPIDETLTLYRSRATDVAVGYKISGVRVLAEKAARLFAAAPALLAACEAAIPCLETAVRAGLDGFTPQEVEAVLASHRVLALLRGAVQKAKE
jgi:hypothetical protein